jgi:hypothetical protein
MQLFFFLVWTMRYVCENPGSAFWGKETGGKRGGTHGLFCKLDKGVSTGFTTGRTSFVEEEVEGSDGPEFGEEGQECVLVHCRMQVADVQPVFQERLLWRGWGGGIAVGGRAGLVGLVGEGEERRRRRGHWAGASHDNKRPLSTTPEFNLAPNLSYMLLPRTLL